MNTNPEAEDPANACLPHGRRQNVVGFWGYPQPGGGAHPPIPSEEVLGDGAESTLRQGLKNTRFRVVRAAGA